MKPDYWKQLVRAARQAPPEPPAEMPFGFDTRVLAACRTQSESGGSDEAASLWSHVLRRGLACSAVIVVVSVILNYQSLREREPGPVAIADSALRMSMLP